MKLTITLSELERGVSIQGGPKDRQLDLAVMANRREPVAIRPVVNHERKIISAVLLTGADSRKNEVELRFRPIWCKLFTLCSSTKDKLVAIILETEQGQYWIDKTDVARHGVLTLSGNGTDPKVVHESQYILGEILTQERRSDIILNLINFLKEHY